MPRADYKTCRECGNHASEVGDLSHERMCLDCAKRRQEANNSQIHNGTGPYALHRVRRQLMAAHKELLAIQAREA